MNAVQARNNFVPEEKVCVNCDPWMGTISNDINNASADSDSVDLRSDAYDSPEFLACTTDLKAKLRHAGHCVYETDWEPYNAASCSDDDYQHYMTVDWSNTWIAAWHDLKDRFGFVTHHRKC